jgi:hypothetical protein
MKCPGYEPDDYGCRSPMVFGRCPNIGSDKPCSLGWITFWTPAERAGLKRMGTSLRTFRPMSEYPTFQEGLLAHRAIIRAYVKAARKSKAEGEKR